MTLAPLDPRDAAILDRSIRAFNAQGSVPRQGDYVVFADGVTRRVSDTTFGVQTSDGGSWYFEAGICSFSGGLYSGVPRESLTLTSETRDGSVWFFHHGIPGGGRGVDAVAPFRVYTCNLPSTR